MQKYDLNEVDTCFDFIEKSTDKIDEILQFQGRLNIQQIETINSIYKQKQEKLSLLEKLYDSDDGKNFIKQNHEHFHKRASRITLKEKTHIDEMEKRVKELKLKLRNLVSQKSVLIYSKGRAR